MNNPYVCLLIRDRIRNASDDDLPRVLTEAVQQLLQANPRKFVKLVSKFVLQDIVANACDALSAADDGDPAERNGNEDTHSGASNGEGGARAHLTDQTTGRPIPMDLDEVMPPNRVAPSCSPLSTDSTFWDDGSGLSDISPDEDAELHTMNKLEPLFRKNKFLASALRSVSRATSPLAHCGISRPNTPAKGTEKPAGERRDSVDPWSSCYTNFGFADEIPPLIDQDAASTQPSPKNGVTKGSGSAAAGPSPPGTDQRPDEEDISQYTTFDQKDYCMSGTNQLRCLICEMDDISVNLAHVKSVEHRSKLESLSKPEMMRAWEITAGGFMRCTLCDVECDIWSTHALTTLHVQAKKFKMSEEIAKVKWDMRGGVPIRALLDEVTTIRLRESDWGNFCVLCQQQFHTPMEKRKHLEKSAEHRSQLQQLKRNDVLSYRFGFMLRKTAFGGFMVYCVLCKVGVTNFHEADYHLHGASSQHHARLRSFWSRVFPALKEFKLLSAFPAPVRGMSKYSLDALLDPRKTKPGSLQRVVMLGFNDELRLCCLCDEHLYCDEEVKEHFGSQEHEKMEKQFIDSFQKVKQSSGLIKKRRQIYCVLCRMGFSNIWETEWHVTSLKPHRERIRLFYLNFKSHIFTQPSNLLQPILQNSNEGRKIQLKVDV